jgi:hypothetical protein
MNARISLALVLLSSGALAQTTVTLSDPILEGDFGYAVAALADLNGDGRPEVAVGQGGADTTAGGVRVYDLASGTVLHSLTQPVGTSNYGFSLSSVPDIDGDGVGDLIIGAPAIPSVLPVFFNSRIDVISGQTGALIVSASTVPAIEQLGYDVAGLDDVNGDGTPDFAAGANSSDFFATNAGRAYVFSGTDGSEIWSTDGDAAQQAYGSAVARIADVNGDGINDVIVGAPGSAFVDILSGVDGALIRRLTDPAPSFGANIGFSVDATGDINGDGIQDVVVGSPAEDMNGAQSGGVRVFSGADGAVLLTLHGGFTNDFFGFAVSGAGDMNADGVPDMLIGSPEIGSSSFYPPGRVRVTSGADGSLISIEMGNAIGSAFGSSVDFAGSVNGGPDTWIGGAPALHEAIAVLPDIGANYCMSTPNSSGFPALIYATGSESIAANNLTLVSGPMDAGQPGLFYYGPNEVQVPFGNGFRCVGGSVFRLFPFAVSSAAGILSYPLNHAALSPAGQISAGQTVKFQAWFRDPAGGGAGFDLSDGLSVTFAP